VITVEWGMTGEPLRERIVRMLPSGCELCPPERLPQANAVLVGEGTFGSEELARAECLRLIQLTSLDNPGVDLGAAADRGIPVSGVRLAHHVGVAEHAFLLILALARHLMESDRAVRDRQAYPCKEQVAPGSNFAYNWPHLGGLVDLAGKTLGLVGLGRIGIEVARRARAFEMEVLYWKRTRLPVHLEGELGVTFTGLRNLLSVSDFVSLHVPLTEETTRLIGRLELSWMKPTAYLINTSRGAVVDEEALVEALHSGALAGAGLDVYTEEPLPRDHALLSAPNTVLTPHTGSTYRTLDEAYDDIASRIVDNLHRLAGGKNPVSVINGVCP